MNRRHAIHRLGALSAALCAAGPSMSVVPPGE